jgi:hypothetical protein
MAVPDRKTCLRVLGMMNCRIPLPEADLLLGKRPLPNGDVTLSGHLSASVLSRTTQVKIS